MPTHLLRELRKLKHGDHVCPIHENATEQVAVAVHFIMHGLEKGERCIYVADHLSVEKTFRAFAAAGMDVARERERGALQILTEQDSYLRSGEFNAEAMIDFLAQTEVAALADGFSGLRALGEMSWVTGAHVNCDRLIEYETLLNKFLAGSHSIISCQYNHSRFDPAVIHDILRAHPVAVLGELVCPNPYYEPPELTLCAEERASAEFKRKRVSWWIARLKAARRAEQEREQARQLVQESRERLQSILDSMFAFVVLLTPEGILMEVNRAPLEAAALGSQEVIGQPFAETYWWSYSAEAQAQLRGALKRAAQGETVRADFQVRIAGQQVITVDTIFSPLRDASGKIVQLVVSAVDITERKQAEERVREQAAMLDQAHDAIIVRDIETRRITYWNQGAERLYGWTAAEAEGCDIGELIFADPNVPDAVTEELLRAGEWRGESRQVTKADRKLMVSGHATLVRDAQGAPKSALVINIDVTAQKELEARFLRAQRMESIGTLAGGIAHDLNNVLGPIITALELLAMKFTDPGSQELLAILSSSAQHGADMVRQVLSFARGVEGRRMEVQVRHLVQEIEKIANDTFLKHIQVRTIIPHDLWTVLGDPTQLHQVLLNLCVNARDAMPDGGTLTISAENLTLDSHYAGLDLETKPGPYVFLQVKDSGTGMPPEIVERIFDPFFTTKEVGKGTGLGLSTSLGIVKSHGGFIRVYSELGNGTNFQVYLPAQTEASPAAAAELVAQMPRGHGELILVVDDEASVRQITKQTLEAFGYRVILASDGAEAVAVFAREGAEIAAVLTDMTMPVMDGPAAIQVLRKMNPKVPIIAASGLSANAQVAHAASLGVQHFLPKPYTAEILLKTLKQVLSTEA